MGAPGNIFLVGPMGAGKTTVGRRLAQLRGLEFADSDQEVIARTGVDIAYIFEKEGEAGFRRRERQVIEELTQRKGLVLATGGGAVLDAENRRHLGARGFVVYLRASLEQQLRRTARLENRPLLQVANKREVLEQLFDIRDPLYREVADFAVDTAGSNAPRIAQAIIAHLDETARATG